jgi:hypothetical protein
MLGLSNTRHGEQDWAAVLTSVDGNGGASASRLRGIEKLTGKNYVPSRRQEHGLEWLIIPVQRTARSIAQPCPHPLYESSGGKTKPLFGPCLVKHAEASRELMGVKVHVGNPREVSTERKHFRTPAIIGFKRNRKPLGGRDGIRSHLRDFDVQIQDNDFNSGGHPAGFDQRGIGVEVRIQVSA